MEDVSDGQNILIINYNFGRLTLTLVSSLAACSWSATVMSTCDSVSRAGRLLEYYQHCYTRPDRRQKLAISLLPVSDLQPVGI